MSNALASWGKRKPSASIRSRTVLTLFSGKDDLASHRARLVLAAKGVSYELVIVDPASPPEDLLHLNPYHSLPPLDNRDLVLYDVDVIPEYLDERYPHPPLMPVDPLSARASGSASRAWTATGSDTWRPNDVTPQRALVQPGRRYPAGAIYGSSSSTGLAARAHAVRPTTSDSPTLFERSGRRPRSEFGGGAARPSSTAESAPQATTDPS